MKYDFDRVVDRRGTDSEKFDFAVEHGLPADVLPLWVADMDFQAPPEVLQALRGCVDHGIFGYTGQKPDYFEAVTGWFERRFGWRTQAGWIVPTPGVVFALATAVRALTAPGEGVLIQPPVYPPFFGVVKRNDRKLVECPLVRNGDRYEVDFEAFEKAVAEGDVKLFILCSPHNPVGRVWTVEELRRMGDICQRHGVIVVSDEIHCDFSWPEHPHTPFIQAVPEMAQRALVCTAPSKTFNLAGLQASNVFIPSEALRKRFTDELGRTGWGGLNGMGQAACKAAYRHGADWLDALKDYLRGNVDFLRDYLRDNLPMLKLIEPEGTYLAWIDFSGLNLTPGEIHDLVANRAKLWLDDGTIFGDAGAQYQRVVLACPRATLEKALERLKEAIV